MAKLKIEGSLGYSTDYGHYQFAALEVTDLIQVQKKVHEGYRVLTNVEIVVYGYIVTDYYNRKSRRVLFNDTPETLADYINIDYRSVKSALDSLTALGMLKKLVGGYTTRTTIKKDYIAVPLAFLISPIVTTAQKAFLLRLAALEKAGALSELEVSGAQIARSTNVPVSSVRKSIQSLVGVEDAPWMTYKDNVLTIDYDHLREMVVKDFIEYYKRNKFKSTARKRAEERLSTQLQVKYKLNNKSKRKGSTKKQGLILRLEELQMNHLADQLELLRAEKYIKQSRLTNAENILDRVDKSLESLES